MFSGLRFTFFAAYAIYSFTASTFLLKIESACAFSKDIVLSAFSPLWMRSIWLLRCSFWKSLTGSLLIVTSANGNEIVPATTAAFNFLTIFSIDASSISDSHITSINASSLISWSWLSVNITIIVQKLRLIRLIYKHLHKQFLLNILSLKLALRW